jgi:transcriptional regulator with XRE-family HTH domain
MSETFPSKKQMRSLMRRILSEEEVQFLTSRVAKATRSISEKFSSRDELELENSIRFQAVATRLRERREKSGMDLKAAAKALGVPRYRLREVEGCRMKNLDASVLHRYVDYLGIGRWFSQWSKAHLELAADLLARRESGADPRGRKKPGRTGAKLHGMF